LLFAVPHWKLSKLKSNKTQVRRRLIDSPLIPQQTRGSHLIYPFARNSAAALNVLRLKEPGASALLPAFPIARLVATILADRLFLRFTWCKVLYGTDRFCPSEIHATPSVASFFTDITQSSYFDMLAEYTTAGVTAADGTAGTNQTLGHGFL